MAAGRKVETQERVARRHQRHEGGGIRRRARVRLHVGESASEKLGDPFDRQRFCNVHILAAAVIAPAGQPFRVFVGENGALGFQHRLADDVLGGDQFDLVALAAELLRDGVRDLRIGLRE